MKEFMTLAFPFPLLFLMLILNTSCRLFNKSEEKPHPSLVKVDAVVEAGRGLKLTTQGNNFEASFSLDGNKICFVSSQRLAHRNRQLYEFTIANGSEPASVSGSVSGSERRVSFSDGDIFSPIYADTENNILYSSSTDEVKEQPKLFYPELYAEHIPQDLYRSDTYGQRIDRVFQLPGTQGQLSPILGSPFEFSFISTNLKSAVAAQKTQVLKIKFPTNGSSPTTSMLFAQVEAAPKKVLVAKSGDSYWLQNDSLYLKKQTGKPIKFIFDKRVAVKVLDAKWVHSKNTQLILLAQNDQLEYRILNYDPLKNCLKLLYSTSLKITGVDFSEKAQRLLFSLEENDMNNLYIQDLKDQLSPSQKCESAQLN